KEGRAARKGGGARQGRRGRWRCRRGTGCRSGRGRGSRRGRGQGGCSVLMSRDRVLLGVVAAPHGVRGLVRIRSYTGDPMAVGTYGPLSDETGRKEYR